MGVECEERNLKEHAQGVKSIAFTGNVDEKRGLGKVQYTVEFDFGKLHLTVPQREKNLLSIFEFIKHVAQRNHGMLDRNTRHTTGTLTCRYGGKNVFDENNLDVLKELEKTIQRDILKVKSDGKTYIKRKDVKELEGCRGSKIPRAHFLDHYIMECQRLLEAESADRRAKIKEEFWKGKTD